MKRITIITVLSASLVLPASCTRECAAPAGGRAAVTVSVKGPSTKASGAYDAGEASVSSLQVFCFDASSGVREDSGSSSGGAVTLNVSAGVKHVYAVANAPAMSFDTEAAFLSASSELSANSPSALQMASGPGDEAVFEVTGDCSLELTLRRLAAKVIVDRITADFANPSFRSQDFIVSSICMDNAAADASYGTDAAPSAFWQGTEDNGAAVNALIRDAGLSYNLRDGGSMTEPHGFYVYPNATQDSTRVVIGAALLGAEQRYAFSLPPIVRNRVYEVTDITITRQSGELSPVSVTVKVADWDGRTDTTYVY